MTDFSALERFLQTDPRDVGCEQALAVLHVYAEFVASGAEDPEGRFAGVAAHLAVCGPCGEDFEGLLGTVRTPPGAQPTLRDPD